MCCLANGDWCQRDRVEHYIHPSVNDASLPGLRLAIEVGLCSAMRPARPHTYPRHRWLGADRAYSDLGLLQGVHCILQFEFPKFVTLMADKPSEVRRSQDVSELHSEIAAADASSMAASMRDTGTSEGNPSTRWADATSTT